MKIARAFVIVLITLAIAAGVWEAEPEIVERPSASPSGTLAILVTGDGGWRAIDRTIADELSAHGVSVVGLVSSKYFAQRRTPIEASRKLAALIETYGTRWGTRRVILAGYSRGAGVLPFMASRLPAVLRGRIAVIALVGLDREIDFAWSPKILFSRAEDTLTIPVRPELAKLSPTPVLCFQGVEERDSLCSEVSSSLVTRVMEPGSHHFGGHYEAIARRIMQRGGVTIAAGSQAQSAFAHRR